MTRILEGAREAREAAELRRSTAEARRREREALVLSEAQRTRYISPPAGVRYPLEYAFHLLPELRGKAVVDLGCGGGENTVCLTLRDANVIGLDISAELVALARRRVAANGFRADFIVASATDTGLPDAHFDVVFGAAILHHLDVGLAGREVRRILKPGGCAIFSEPVRVSKLAHLYRRLIPATGDEISPGEYPLNENDIRIFNGEMSLVDCRAFELPHLKLTDGRWQRALDRYALDRCGWLSAFARIRVWKCIKSAKPV